MTWKITITAPTGDISATLQISSAEGKVYGSMSGKAGTGPMEDIVMTDKKLAWSTKIQKPMPMSLKFDGRIDGDTISGSVKFGIFASGTFAGERAALPTT